MATYEHSYELTAPFTVEDLSPEVMQLFGEYCRRTEKDMLRDVFRESIRIEAPFPVSAGEEADIFRSVFEDV